MSRFGRNSERALKELVCGAWCLVFTTVCAFADRAWAQDYWIGDLNVVMARGSFNGKYPVCGDRFVSTGASVVFDSWSRSRALVTNLCFSVWLPAVTDTADAQPSDLQAYVEYQDASGFFLRTPAHFAGRDGNNFRYFIDLRDFDPVQYGRSSNGNTLTELNIGLAVTAPGKGFYRLRDASQLKFTAE